MFLIVSTNILTTAITVIVRVISIPAIIVLVFIFQSLLLLGSFLFISSISIDIAIYCYYN